MPWGMDLKRGESGFGAPGAPFTRPSLPRRRRPMHRREPHVCGRERHEGARGQSASPPLAYWVNVPEAGLQRETGVTFALRLTSKDHGPSGLLG